MVDSSDRSPHHRVRRARNPRCSCGRPTVPVAHEDGTLWLECSSLTEPKSAVRRLLELSGAHTQVEILPAT